MGDSNGGRGRPYGRTEWSYADTKTSPGAGRRRVLHQDRLAVAAATALRRRCCAMLM
jgi:hypothetical protein